MLEIWRDICFLLYLSLYDKVLIFIKRNLEIKLRCRKNDFIKKRKSRLVIIICIFREGGGIKFVFL